MSRLETFVQKVKAISLERELAQGGGSCGAEGVERVI